MINRIIAYKAAELEKKEILSQARDLYKSKLLSEEQWQKIRETYASELYTPSVFMKILLFIFSIIGMSTIFGPITLLIDDAGESVFQIMSFLFGISLLVFTELILIKRKLHYKSGVTEAGIFSGFAFLTYGLVGYNDANAIPYYIVGFIFMTFAAIRYLNLVALVLSVVFFCFVLLQILTDIGGEAWIPFLFMVTFTIIYWGIKRLQIRLTNIIFESQFVIIKTMALLVIYLAGNYFVVRHLSVEFMNLNLSEGQDIPFAFVFYMLTALIPVGYLLWGIKQKSILWIRVSLLTIALSVATFKYYFSLGHPVLAITIAGAILIIIALVFFNFLKNIRSGFTRELLFAQ